MDHIFKRCLYADRSLVEFSSALVLRDLQWIQTVSGTQESPVPSFVLRLLNDISFSFHVMQKSLSFSGFFFIAFLPGLNA